jgi:hypothetical protein
MEGARRAILENHFAAYHRLFMDAFQPVSEEVRAAQRAAYGRRIKPT